MNHGEFGGLIRRKQPVQKKLILPPERSPLKIRATPKEPSPPERSPLNIKVKPKPPEPPEHPAAADFARRAEELRKRVTDRNPEMATQTRLTPTRTQLNLHKKGLEQREPLKLNVRPKSYFEWVRAA